MTPTPRRIRWDPGVFLLLSTEARDAFPNEACGAVLGAMTAGERESVIEVDRVLVCSNVASDPMRRYEIAPEELFAVQKASRRDGLEVVGFWHSHPDGSSRPSDEDLRHAFSGVSFVILPVDEEMVGRPRAWWLDRETGHWRELRIEVRSSDTGI